MCCPCPVRPFCHTRRASQRPRSPTQCHWRSRLAGLGGALGHPGLEHHRAHGVDRGSGCFPFGVRTGSTERGDRGDHQVGMSSEDVRRLEALSQRRSAPSGVEPHVGPARSSSARRGSARRSVSSGPYPSCGRDGKVRVQLEARLDRRRWPPAPARDDRGGLWLRVRRRGARTTRPTGRLCPRPSHQLGAYPHHSRHPPKA